MVREHHSIGLLGDSLPMLHSVVDLDGIGMCQAMGFTF
jgi:hypothetical protein